MNASHTPYALALRRLGERHPEIVVIDAGLATSMQTSAFETAFPDRYVNLGIAEANAVSFASGLARRGFRPFVHSFANFLARRAHDQIAISAALPALPVIFIAGSCGIYDGRNGASHFAPDDIAAMSALPGMSVYEPADVDDLSVVLEAAATAPGPSYIRLRRNGMPKRLGQAAHTGATRSMLETPNPRVTVVAIGSLLDETLTACLIAGDNGLRVDLLHVSRIKPLAVDLILVSARASRATFIVENHVATGGAGQALAARLAEEGLRCRIAGLPDTPLPAGDPPFLMRITKLDAASLAARVAAFAAEGG